MAKQETELQELIINYLPYEEYKAAKEAGEINPNELYCTPDDEVNPPSMISDEFDPNKTYAVGDYCIAYNKLWRCLVQCQGVYPAEGTYWTACMVASELKSSRVKHYTFTATTSVNGNVNFDNLPGFESKIVVAAVVRNTSTGLPYVAIPYRYAGYNTTTRDINGGLHIFTETSSISVVANTNVTITAYYFDL